MNLVCPRCDVPYAPGEAIEQTWIGHPEWPGDTIYTMSPGGPGRLVPCLKCPKCGHSVTTDQRAAERQMLLDNPSAAAHPIKE
jgi:hypothetical protein